MIKIERKIKKKKKNKLSAGLKTAIGVLGGLAATTGLINKAPAGKVNVAQALVAALLSVALLLEAI